LEEALKVVDQFLDHYQRYCLKGERFGEILERTGIIELRGKKEELLETGKGS
jgi:dissimilatory sulfite reductase (desulfoviridin) alpha/beta subunit